MSSSSYFSENQNEREVLRNLRLRLGWSQSDLARRLQCCSADIEAIEAGEAALSSEWKNALELLARQADLCSEELHATPLLEKMMDNGFVEQLDFNDIKLDIQS